MKESFRIFLIIIIFIVLAGVSLLIYLREEDPLSNDLLPSDYSNSEQTNELIEWNGKEVRNREGIVLISAETMPKEIAVSSEASFGGTDQIMEAKVSPDGSWIALVTAGAAHNFGWLYNIRQNELMPVVFQYGGMVEIFAWNPTNSDLIAFLSGGAGPFKTLKVVNRLDVEEFPAETGFVPEINLVAEDDLYTIIGWREDMFCFEILEKKYCADIKTRSIEPYE